MWWWRLLLFRGIFHYSEQFSLKMIIHFKYWTRRNVLHVGNGYWLPVSSTVPPWQNIQTIWIRAEDAGSLSEIDLFHLILQACTTQKARRAKLTNINLPRAAKSISFCCSLKEILERQLLYIRSRAIAKALAGRICIPLELYGSIYF